MLVRLMLGLLALIAVAGPVALPALAQNNAVDAVVVTNAADPVANVVTPAPAATPAPEATPAATPQLPRDDMSAAGVALLRLFLLAVVLERALALLFGWRPFIAIFDGQGIRTPISFVMAMLITHYFHTDALVQLFKAYGNNLAPDGVFFARTLEAMVIAGGGAGVAQLMRQLGFQPPQSADDIRPKPKDETEAWISVALDGSGDAVNFPAYVWLTPDGGAPFEAGTIYKYSGKQSFASYFFRNRGRFPQSGGYVVTPKVPYSIQVIDSSGKAFPVKDKHTLGPRAIIDIVIDA